jgi:hypothetical protein
VSAGRDFGRCPGGLAGLCATCAHARPVRSARGSTFWRCGLSERDARFPKYPRLPVLACEGFVRASTGEREAPPSTTT